VGKFLRYLVVDGVRQIVETDAGWRDIPPEIAAYMQPGISSLVDEMVTAIALEVPEYARPLDGAYSAMIRRGVSQSVRQFVGRVANPVAPRGETAEFFRRIGRIEAAEGRSLEPFQASLRIGARVAWNRLHQTAARTQMDLASFAAIGEAIFLHLDEIAAAVAEGFAQAQAETAGERERGRRRLLDLLFADPPASPDAIADQALAAGWRLPGRVAAVVLEDPGRQDFVPLPSMPPEVLVDMSRREPRLLVPDADGPGRTEFIRRGLRGWRAAVGPAVPLNLAADSLRWASQALALGKRGVLPWEDGVVWCAAYMPQLVMFSDEALLRRFREGTLTPLSGLPQARQDRLAETALAWLQCWGNASAAARRLHVHPQTIRYRMRQVRELFGADLREPDRRFALEVALRASLALSEDRAAPAARGD
jgi:hypothetical protein